MKNHVVHTVLLLIACTFLSKISFSQDCSLLKATFVTYESRCAATGSIKVFATGGSGSYKYQTIGPVNTNFTTTDSITGLSAGTYTVVVNDISTNCTFTQTGVVVKGSYQDPRFALNGIDVTCDNGSNGSITADSLSNGRSPFAYTIVAPSPMSVGTSNNTGTFNNLIAGNYTVRLTDSCGGIQTRTVTINNYSWRINSDAFHKVTCDSVSGSVTVLDSKGNVSTAGGIPNFMYGIVRQPGDTLWSSSPYLSFHLSGNAPFQVIAKDGCGIIKKVSTSVSFIPNVGTSVNISNTTCNSFSVTLDSISNFNNGSFCLYDSGGVQLQCNSSGVFTNLPYGYYCITAHDACTDTTITRCFTAKPPAPSLGSLVIISNKTCTAFTATITGQTNLTNPKYCLYDSSDTQLYCNSTGIFDGLSYSSYCVKVTDGCIDTTITRCFTATRPVPVVDSIIPTYANCSNFGIHVTTDSISNPTFCLYDSSGNLIQCDSTGIFDSIPLGSYCVHVHDACTDKTIIQCFDVDAPIITNDITISFSNNTCSSFTAKVNTTVITSAYYCLYDTANVLIVCDSSGVFDNLPYGNYCVHAGISCPDTTFIVCFQATRPVPSVSASVITFNNSCTSFSAKITGKQNLNNAQYCLYDSNNVQLSCDTTGVFDNLPYGSYCIKITDSCYDTTITRCFIDTLKPITVNVIASKSCDYGFSNFNVSVSGGALPLHVTVSAPFNNVVLDGIYNTDNFFIDSLPGLATGETYTVIVSDNCGNIDSASVSPITSYFNHTATVVPSCPGGSWPNGSGSIQAAVSTNMGSLSVKIIKKDGVSLSPYLGPSMVASGVYTFNNLGPATYILGYKANDSCNNRLYDTVTVAPYQFPDLSKSSAYQCDVNGFSVSAVVSNGVGPFSYEIIGSVPSSPSIITGAQSTPLFNINNGTNYSLIRMRAIDACGNATLGDASILPLAIDEITVTSNCFSLPTTLFVDSIPNSTYAWYKKTNASDNDSTLIGTASSYFIPEVSSADTGIYICHIEVYGGCVKRTDVFDLNASCFPILTAKTLDFSGKLLNNVISLNWQTNNGQSLDEYIVERKNSDGSFSQIGSTNLSHQYGNMQQFSFLDTKPSPGENYYRLKLISNDNTFSYSNIILVSVNNDLPQINIYPNPVTNAFNIYFNNPANHVFQISIYTTLNQLIKTYSFATGLRNQFTIERTKAMVKGVYFVRITDKNSNQQYSQRVIFK